MLLLIIVLLLLFVARPLLIRYFAASMRRNSGKLSPNALAVLFVALFLCAVATNLIGIFAVFGAGNSQHDGGKGVLIYADNAHLHGPIALTLGPNGHLFVANGDAINSDPNQPSELVEYSSTGVFLAQMPIDPNNGGAFGLAALNAGWGTVRLAAVDDNTNTLHLWTTVIP